MWSKISNKFHIILRILPEYKIIREYRTSNVNSNKFLEDIIMKFKKKTRKVLLVQPGTTKKKLQPPPPPPPPRREINVQNLLFSTGDDNDKIHNNDKIKLSPDVLSKVRGADLDGADKEVSTEGVEPEKSPGGGSDGFSDNYYPQVNRPVRMEPGKCLMCLIPADWPSVLHQKTGVTGFYTLAFTFSTYLLSKEILIMEHNYYGGLSMFVMCWGAVKYVGPGVAKAIDKEIDAYENGWNESRVAETAMLEEQIQDEHNLQSSSEAQLVLLDAKRENVDLQLEADFRERQMQVYHEVLKRLDYYVAREEIERRLAHRNFAAWVKKQVLQAITPEFEDAIIKDCFQKLEDMAAKQRSVAN